MRNTSILLTLVFILASSCSKTEEFSGYKVARVEESPEINAIWDKSPWKSIKTLQLTHYMGDEPEHFPLVQAKIAYDNLAVYVIFRVEDRYVKAVHGNHQDPVWKDSCVEFFFSPEDNTEKGYFNLEMNCGGTMLFHHQTAPRTDRLPIAEEHVQQVEVAHSMPKIVDPEIEEETTWYVEYRIPFSILGNYRDFSIPETGSIWRANLYKCADETSHPHWITWEPIDAPGPDFHRPEFFGVLEFE
ncbi:MAG: carbohydrate-binding family 9-like protein [Bacteroidota bacterium]